MDLDELKEKVSSIVQMDEIGLNVFFLLKTEEGQVLKRANIIEDVKSSLIASYKSSLNGIISNEELSMINLSSADDRQNVIYFYDLEERPGIFEFFNDITNDGVEAEPDYFSFNDDNLEDLEGYFVFIGDADNNLLLYRKQMPINLFKRGKIYLIKGHESQFDRIDQEFLRIDSKVDIMQIGDLTFIKNISILERHYEFKDIIEREAGASVENIESLDILENIEVLQERISDTVFARKLSKISTTSPVFELPSEQIMAFVRNHHVLTGEFRYNADQSKIVLDTKKSQNFFLKLMNDDFLHSELTNFDYMTPAKDKLE